MYSNLSEIHILKFDLKIARESMKPEVRNILQKSLNEKKFPGNWKVAKLKTTFKKGEACNRENYHPLSI